MASRKITDLALVLQEPCLELIHGLKVQHIDLLITCTYRSYGEQGALYAQGRSRPGLIVTNAMPGESAHNRVIGGRAAALAFDVVPILAGKPIWSLEGRNIDLWKHIGETGERLGLEWGGRWIGRAADFPHFQLRDWKKYGTQE
jgi:peptidoglycan LD-endopeptidase CwlK